VIAAGTIYTYSFPGLFWLAGAAAVYPALELVRGAAGAGSATFSGLPATSRRRDNPRGRWGGYRLPLLAGASALVVLAVLTAPEWTRMVDFSNFRAFRHSALSSGLGNLRHQVSPLEGLGIWPASDFRLSAADATAPAAAFYLGALLAAAALVLGLPSWIRRHGLAVPSALIAAAGIYIGARIFGTVYTSAKALAIAAPLVTLIALGGLLDPGRFRLGRATTAWRIPLAVVVALGILASSFLVLRQAPIGPTDHAAELAELRPLLHGKDVLFLGRDNFIAYELRGARPFTAVRNFYDPNYVKPDLRLADVFQKFDFDSVRPRTLNRFPYVITTRAAYASGPPPSFSPVARTQTFQLWKRTGPMGPRHTLDEGASPGATLDCATKAGRRVSRNGGTATIFGKVPVTGARWSPSATVQSGAPVTQTLRVPAGRWEVSIQYDATRPVRITAPGFGASLPGNLDYRGSVPFYPAGTLKVGKPGPVIFIVSVERPPLAGRLLGAKSEAHLGAIALSPSGRSGPHPGPGEAEIVVPLSGACGRYVDWYRRAPRP
jgi:hypothetical protein